MPDFSDTIAALATPVGTSAIAVVRVSGAQAGGLARALWGETPLPRLVSRGDYVDRAGGLVDDVLFVFFQGPRSYTGEDSLEISCHGNPFIAQRILDDLVQRGCRAAEPGEFTQRAFLHGRMDLTQAEAVMDLIHARSERALAAANRQLRGALARRVNDAVESLLAVLAKIEAYIDFPEEDLPAEDRADVLARVRAVGRQAGELLATGRYGELLREGIATVIVGPPNVGKSSLLNRLVGHERALVSAEAGTTRDFIEERILLEGSWLRLIDTAGLNARPGELERLGMEKTFERVAAADLYIVVGDATQSGPAAALPPRVWERLSAQNTVFVFNKIDLPHAPLPSPPIAGAPVVGLSAITGEGVEDLVAAVKRFADSFQTTRDDELVAINVRHAGALEDAQRGLDAALDQLAAGGPIELVASELRGALAAFGQIAGKVDNERMLDHLFAGFCIGK